MRWRRVSGSVGRGFWTVHMQGGPGALCLLGGVRGVLEMSVGPGKSQQQPEATQGRAGQGAQERQGQGCTRSLVAPKVLSPHSTEAIAEVSS